MRVKKLLIGLFTLVVAMGLMTGCSQSDDADTETPEEPTQSQTQTEEPAEPKESGDPEITEASGVTIPEFTVTVNGIAVDQDTLASSPIYEMQTTSVNSKGSETTAVYQGFKIKDVLEAAGLTDNYVWLEVTATDGYTVVLTGDMVSDDTTLLAINRDGNPFGEGPWLAPGKSDTSGDYAKNVASILVNVEEGAPDIDDANAVASAGDQPSADETPELKDRTDKVEFQPFSFKVNGQDMTNAEMDGKSIYKVTATTVNKEGATSSADYTGYAMKDVLEAAGVADFDEVTVIANDGYETVLPHDVAASEYTIVAIEKDKETGEDGTIWVAPTLEKESKNYPKYVVELKTN